jgi:hypothetical protein
MTRPEPAYATLRYDTTVRRVLKRKRPRPKLNSLEGRPRHGEAPDRYRLADENPDWRAPQIHGELRKPGFIVSERRVAR